MDKARQYLALLILAESNLRVLHWKLCGVDFLDAHKRFQEYYENIGTFVDETAERIVVMGGVPLNIRDALHIIENDESDCIIIDASVNYSSQDANRAAKKMFDDLCDLAVELAEDSGIAIDTRDTFLQHSTYFENEGCYKLERFLCTPGSAAKSSDDDDD